MNILSIGNSFSQDAQRYLHRIAKADGFTLNTFNQFMVLPNAIGLVALAGLVGKSAKKDRLDK